MRSLPRFGFLAVALVVAGCGSDGPSGPSGAGVTINGVFYSATVTEVVHSTSRQFSVTVRLENRGNDEARRNFPVSCPVRVRLYRQLDGKLVYDETKLACASSDLATLAIPAGQQYTLSSGIRFPATIAGDSLSTTSYIVKAVAQTEGTRLVELTAGTYTLPKCEQSGTQTVCT